MTSLLAKTRRDFGKQTKKLRDAERIPAVVYGHNVKNMVIDLDYKDFQNAYSAAGESSLIDLTIEGEKDKRLVLVHDIQRDYVSGQFIHIDFLQPSLKEEVEVKIPLVLEGEAPAVKDLGGTLVKNISEIEVKALPQNLPHEVVLNISNLKTFEDRILARDLVLPKEVTLNIDPEEIIISVAKQTDVEAELKAEIEEKVEEVEKVEKEKKEEEVVLEEAPEKAPAKTEAKEKK